jgi:hypothetical protein
MRCQMILYIPSITSKAAILGPVRSSYDRYWASHDVLLANDPKSQMKAVICVPASTTLSQLGPQVTWIRLNTRRQAFPSNNSVSDQRNIRKSCQVDRVGRYRRCTSSSLCIDGQMAQNNERCVNESAAPSGRRCFFNEPSLINVCLAHMRFTKGSHLGLWAP